MSGPLGWLRKEPSTAEVARQGKREVRKGQRDLQREIATLDREERQAITQAKALAKRGDQRGARVQAAHIARIRQQRDRLYQGKAQLSGVGLQTTSMQATATVQNAMASATKVMTATNKQMDVGKMQATMQQFERQQEIASMSEEMLDDMLNDELDDEESDEVLDKVFDEIGLDLAGTLAKAKTPTATPGTPLSAQVPEREAELRKLLAQLE